MIIRKLSCFFPARPASETGPLFLLIRIFPFGRFFRDNPLKFQACSDILTVVPRKEAGIAERLQWETARHQTSLKEEHKDAGFGRTHERGLHQVS